MSSAATGAVVAPAAAAPAAARWFAADPDKARGEKFFLLYSPVWMVAFGFYQRSRVGDTFGDFGNLGLALAIFLPPWIVPPLLHRTRPWTDAYWLKFDVWILVYSAIATYFFTEYFFDVMGMVYHYPHLHWTFDATLLGGGRQRVPVIMYLHAHYFFLTYHATAVVVLRRLRTSRLGASPFARALAVVVVAWFWAWAEIRFTTDPSFSDQFRYEDLGWALRWGALFYACYFVVSFPMVGRIDEEPADRWTLGRTAADALAAGMLTFVLLDLVAKVTGTPWRG